MLALSREDIRQAITMSDAIDAARTAFRTLASGQAEVPPRPHLATRNGTSLFMPAYDRSSGSVGLKLVTVTPANPERGRPTVQAVFLLVEEATGTPVAILDGTWLTQVRTGAAIGLAADLLARPDAHTVALFGVGATARTSLEAVCTVRDIREVRTVHPHPESLPAFAAALRASLGSACPELGRVESPAEAIHGAEVVITATTSPEPIVYGELLAPGIFVGALGAYTPTTRELDTATIVRSRLVVDTRAGALREAGDVAIPIAEGAISPDHIWAELGEIAAGSRPGRERSDEIFVFKSVGNAIQDLTLAGLVYERAIATGLGTKVPL